MNSLVDDKLTSASLTPRSVEDTPRISTPEQQYPHLGLGVVGEIFEEIHGWGVANRKPPIVDIGKE